MEEYLKKKKSDKEKMLFILIDPEKNIYDEKNFEKIMRRLAEEGVDAFLIGGSLGVSSEDLDKTLLLLEDIDVPKILFPGSVAGLSKYADAVLFISLLNSDNPYYIIGAQVEGGIIIKKLGLEALPTAYIIIGEGGAAGFMGKARPIHWRHTGITVAYAVAAELMGMRYIYLEAGSGAERSVPKEMISEVRKNTNLFIITGGGIRDEYTACEALEAGSDAIVIGTLFEKDIEKTLKIIKIVKKDRCETKKL